MYAIRNIETGRQYIGSSINIKDRLHSHIRELSLGRHANHVLQTDVAKLGLNHFEADVLARGIATSNLATAEAKVISTFLETGAALYNLTIDGLNIPFMAPDGTIRAFHFSNKGVAS